MANINVRILSANVVKKDIWHKFDSEDQQLIERDLQLAASKNVSNSSRLASILTVEIMFRRKGAQL